MNKFTSLNGADLSYLYGWELALCQFLFSKKKDKRYSILTNDNNTFYLYDVSMQTEEEWPPIWRGTIGLWSLNGYNRVKVATDFCSSNNEFKNWLINTFLVKE